jgi:hypothetical protein
LSVFCYLIFRIPRIQTKQWCLRSRPSPSQVSVYRSTDINFISSNSFNATHVHLLGILKDPVPVSRKHKFDDSKPWPPCALALSGKYLPINHSMPFISSKPSLLLLQQMLLVCRPPESFSSYHPLHQPHCTFRIYLTLHHVFSCHTLNPAPHFACLSASLARYLHSAPSIANIVL